MRLILLLAVALGSVSISHAQTQTSHAAALLDTLTNPPPGFRLVFHKSDANESAFYEIIGQSSLWRGKYAAELEDLDNPKRNIHGGSLPNRQWMIKDHKTNDWNRAALNQLMKRPVPRNMIPEPFPSHGKLTGGYLYAFIVLSLGIAPVSPGTMEVKGTNFSAFYHGAEHVVNFRSIRQAG